MNNSFSTSIYFATVVALGGFIFGFDASVISGVVGFVTKAFALNEWQQGLVVSAPTLGAVFGSFFAGPGADKYGRKQVLLIIALLYLVSAIFSATASGYWMLVIARMIGGIAFASLVLAPMYIAEISPAKVRGKMISINQFNIVVGFSAAYFANFYLLQLSGSTEYIEIFGLNAHVWRWMLGVEIIPATMYFFLLFTIPESPRWLVVQNKTSQAKQVLKRLFATQDPELLVKQIQRDGEQKLPPLLTRLKLLFAKNKRFVLAVGLVVGISQQITGVNAVYFYAPSIFEQSGIGQDAAFSQAIWVGVINVVFTIAAMLLIDRLGRKPLMLIGLVGVFISMSIAAWGFKQATYQLTPHSVEMIENQMVVEKIQPLIDVIYHDDVSYKNALIEVLGQRHAQDHQTVLIQAAAKMNSTLILIGILGFVASFAVSLGPVMWVLLAEIFPNHLRGIGIAFTGLVNSAVSFMVQFLFPWQLANLGTAMTFMIYGGFALLGFVLIYRMLPETKGKSLEDIEAVFTTANK